MSSCPPRTVPELRSFSILPLGTPWEPGVIREAPPHITELFEDHTDVPTGGGTTAVPIHDLLDARTAIPQGPMRRGHYHELSKPKQSQDTTRPGNLPAVLALSALEYAGLLDARVRLTQIPLALLDHLVSKGWAQHPLPQSPSALFPPRACQVRGLLPRARLLGLVWLLLTAFAVGRAPISATQLPRPRGQIDDGFGPTWSRNQASRQLVAPRGSHFEAWRFHGREGERRKPKRIQRLTTADRALPALGLPCPAWLPQNGVNRRAERNPVTEANHPLDREFTLLEQWIPERERALLKGSLAEFNTDTESTEGWAGGQIPQRAGRLSRFERLSWVSFVYYGLLVYDTFHLRLLHLGSFFVDVLVWHRLSLSYSPHVFSHLGFRPHY